MAYQIAALVQCDDADRCAFCKRMLDRSTRPLFADDLPEEHRNLFEAIEEIDYPAETEILPDGLWLLWYRAESFGYRDLLQLLARFGVAAQFIFEVPDAPMSCDADENEATRKYWLKGSRGYVRLEHEKLGDVLPPEIIGRLPG